MVAARRPLAVLAGQAMDPLGIPKIPKLAALYIPRNVLPSIIWKYSCGNCGLFVEPNQCAIVSSVGGPDDGVINPQGWCVVWMPRPEEPAFSRWILMATGRPPIEDLR